MNIDSQFHILIHCILRRHISVSTIECHCINKTNLFLSCSGHIHCDVNLINWSPCRNKMINTIRSNLRIVSIIQISTLTVNTITHLGIHCQHHIYTRTLGCEPLVKSVYPVNNTHFQFREPGVPDGIHYIVDNIDTCTDDVIPVTPIISESVNITKMPGVGDIIILYNPVPGTIPVLDNHCTVLCILPVQIKELPYYTVHIRLSKCSILYDVDYL